MDINTYVEAAKAVMVAHPVSYTLVVAGASALGGRAALVALGDSLVRKAATWEDAKMKSAGLTPDQRKLVLEDQAKAADRTAAALRAQAAAIVPPPVTAAVEPPKPTLAVAAPSVPPTGGV